jgi:hypothetical protein
MYDKKTLIFITVLGLFGGAIVGWVAGNVFSSNDGGEQQSEGTKKESQECDVTCLSDDQISELCLPEEEEIPSEQNEQASATEILQSTQTKVKELEGLLEEKEAELTRLRADSKKSKSGKKAARKKWLEMEAEVAILRNQLDAAITERDELRKELKVTLKKLDKQVKKTKKFKAKAKKYKRESVQNLWKAFTEESKRQICDSGSKRKHVKCWDAVQESLPSATQERFKTCVNTYQAVPVLQKSKKFFPKDSDLPPFSTWINKKNKYTKKWYIIYCDPTLPEKRDEELEDGAPLVEPVIEPSQPENDLTEDGKGSEKTAEDDESLDNFDLDLDLD